MRKRSLVVLLIALILVGCGKTNIVEQNVQSYTSYILPKMQGTWHSPETNERFSFSDDELKIYEEDKLVYDLKNIQINRLRWANIEDKELRLSNIKDRYSFSDTTILDDCDFISISTTTDDFDYYRECVIKDDSLLGIIKYNSEKHQDEIIMMEKNNEDTHLG